MRTRTHTRSAQTAAQLWCRKPFPYVNTHSKYSPVLADRLRPSWVMLPFILCSNIQLNMQNMQVKTHFQSLTSTEVRRIQLQKFWATLKKLSNRFLVLLLLLLFLPRSLPKSKVSCEANGLQLARTNDREPAVNMFEQMDE